MAIKRNKKCTFFNIKILFKDYFIKINYIKKKPEDNVPLVIVANEGVGKKTLLVKWMEFH